MREFLKNNTVNHNLMSYTGFKALMIFHFLWESPKTYEEIKAYFRDNEFFGDNFSIDTFRVYLNSLKKIGCEIKKFKTDTGVRYKLVSHPFGVYMTPEQISGISKIYKIFAKNMDVKDLLSLDKFLRELAAKLNDTAMAEKLNEISFFKDVDIDMLEKLIQCSEKKQVIDVLYKSPRVGKEEFSIIADKIDFKNNKLYLFGIGSKYKNYSYFPLFRILEIKDIKLHNSDNYESTNLTVGYEVKTKDNNFRINKHEKIVAIKENSMIIEITSSNPSIIRQRIFSLGADCKVLYPDTFKEEIVETLKNMREQYLNG